MRSSHVLSFSPIPLAAGAGCRLQLGLVPAQVAPSHLQAQRALGAAVSAHAAGARRSSAPRPGAAAREGEGVWQSESAPIGGEQQLSEFVKPRADSSGQAVEEGSKFVVPRRRLYPLLPCWRCKGTKHTPCACCGGNGRLPRGGYHRRNPVRPEHLVGSKWTAMEPTLGWRHFRVDSRKRAPLVGGDWFVEMVATCDSGTRLWVNASNLKDRERWTMGWVQKVELAALASADKARGGNPCKACHGSGVVPCAACKQREKEGANDSTDIVEV